MKKVFKSIIALGMIMCVHVIVSGCTLLSTGESQEQREQRFLQEKQILKERQNLLTLNVQQRLDAGETPPMKVNDPGYTIVQCVKPEPTDEGFILKGFFSGEDYICQNTTAGEQILEYRKWYCQGEEKICVTGLWENGQPLFKECPYCKIGIAVNVNGAEILVEEADFVWP